MMIHCKNCKQKFYIMNEGSELEGKIIKCKFCNDQSVYESRTSYLENRLAELSKDLDQTEIKIELKKKEHQNRIDELHNDLIIKKEELEKQTLLQDKVNFFENRLKQTEKLNSEEIVLGNEINKIKKKIKTTSENISNQNKDIEKKTNDLETKINSYNSEDKKNSLNKKSFENNTGEIVNINKNSNNSEQQSKNQTEENKKMKKFKFFSPGFIK